MRIVRPAVAGTLESSDALVRITPDDTLRVDVTSSVFAQFGEQIRRVAEQTLDALGVTAGAVDIADKGALDFVIRARVQAAVARASDDPIDWSTW